jgi:hypothetical protein
MSFLTNVSWSDKLPDDNIDVYEPYLKLFFETLYERQMIWYRRFILKQDQPWTDNEFFRNNKFTNVYRELDRNSQWMIKYIMLDTELDLKNLVWKMMFFRYFNKPETFTFSNLMLTSASKWRNGIPNFDEYNADEYYEYLKGVHSTGQALHTDAYITSYGAIGDGIKFYSHIVLPTLHDKLDNLFEVVKTANTPEEIIKFLRTLPGCGKFMAHEFYTDFTYIPKYTNYEFMKFGANDFTNVGPGSCTGIRLIFPSRKINKDRLKAIYELQSMAKEYLDNISAEKGEKLQYLEWNKDKHEYHTITECNITLHQIEMWLCEFQKYWRMMLGCGKQQKKFIPKNPDYIY